MLPPPRPAQVTFYRLGARDGEKVGQRSYIGSVQSVKLNETHVALLIDGRVVVHPIEVGRLPRARDRGGEEGGEPVLAV